jgi:Lar family restriction alleviation protein
VTKPETEKLRDCPFCGHDSPEARFDDVASGGNDWCVVCGECGASSDFYRTEKEAANYWNLRAPGGGATPDAASDADFAERLWEALSPDDCPKLTRRKLKAAIAHARSAGGEGNG